MTAYVIAKHQATERQRRIAEARARIYYANLAPSKKIALKQKRVRYIAVDTEKNEQTSPKAKKSIMIWDTQSQSMAGNSVYDVQSTPAVGGTAKFDNYSAAYAGTGIAVPYSGAGFGGRLRGYRLDGVAVDGATEDGPENCFATAIPRPPKK